MNQLSLQQATDRADIIDTIVRVAVFVDQRNWDEVGKVRFTTLPASPNLMNSLLIYEKGVRHIERALLSLPIFFVFSNKADF